MSRHLNRDLEALEQELLAQGSQVELMINLASQALKELRSDLIEQLMENENEVDDREVAIEEDCLKILALHQPVAVDLRRVTTVMKVNGDLERIADLAVDIGERSQNLITYGSLFLPERIDDMAEAAGSMVRDALDAFVRQDIATAKAVCRRDDVVDQLNKELITELHKLVSSQEADIEPAFHFFSASRHLERIADHATNIAEDVIYLIEGEIARHQHADFSAS